MMAVSDHTPSTEGASLPMLTREEDIDVHALRRQGMSISAIARHLGRDRKTIHAYLAGRESGVRNRTASDPFDRFEAYCAQRLRDDPHLWAATLFVERLELGYVPLPADAASALFQVVSQRYLNTPIILTRNRGVGSWARSSTTPPSPALLDRILHRSVVLTTKGTQSCN